MNSSYKTERLILRQLEKNDIDEYYSMISDKSVYCWLGNRQKKSFEDTVKLIVMPPIVKTLFRKI